MARRTHVTVRLADRGREWLRKIATREGLLSRNAQSGDDEPNVSAAIRLELAWAQENPHPEGWRPAGWDPST